MTTANARILKAATALGIVGGASSTAHRMFATLCSQSVDASDVSAVISQDPGLAARVLRVANSAFYGLARKVHTVDRAVTVLGLDAVRGIAAAACLDRTMLISRGTAPFDPAALVQHSLGAALAAQALACSGHPQVGSEAFIAGLLHDLGASVQTRVDADGQRQVIEALVAEPQRDISELESRYLSVSHEQCAQVVFESWQLPAALTAVARHHHHPLEAPPEHRVLAVLVHLGHQASLRAGYGFALEPPGGSVDEAVLAELGLSEADLESIARQLPQRVLLLAAP